MNETPPTPLPEGAPPATAWRARITEKLSGYARALGTCGSQVPPHKLTLLTLLLALLFGGVIAMRGVDRTDPIAYTDTWRLVEETIAQNAAVRVNPPPGTSVENPREALTITPEVVGEVKALEDGSLLFSPREPLVLGAYYTAELRQGEALVTGSFKVVDNPKVETILPSREGEAHEESEISIIFNRPMVPLTTLGERDTAEIPASLSPETPGTWVWKSSRMLQFVPETRLAQATTYTVRVRAFSGVEGLEVEPVERTFVTRTLKLVSAPEGEHLGPARLTFNMPVDLERTAREVTLREGDTEVRAVVRYAQIPGPERGFLGAALFGRTQSKEDTRVIEVLPQSDRHGRSERWNFESTYTLTLEKAYPLEGDRVLETPLSRTLNIPPILKSTAARSPKTSDVRPDMFDPEGELVLSFHEPIDVRKTKLSLHGLKEVRYDTTCTLDEDENPIPQGPDTSECVREDDHTALVVTVDPGAWTQGARHELRLEEAVSEEGDTLNAEPLVIPVTRYGALALLSHTPTEGTTSASVHELILCTNVPLQTPEREKLGDVVRADNYLVFAPDAWSPSYLVGDESFGNPQDCTKGQFRTVVRYGLHPETRYSLSFDLQDVFGGTLERTLTFTTEPPRAFYARLSALQPMYTSTIPGRTKLTYAAENLEAVTVHVCKVSAEGMVRILEQEPTEYTDTRIARTPCSEESTFVEMLPSRPFTHVYFQVDLAAHTKDPRGQYVVTLFHPTHSQAPDGPGYLRSFVSVSTLSVVQKALSTQGRESEQEVPASRLSLPRANDLYLVTRASTLEPVEGALITPYVSRELWGEARDLTASPSATTGADGVARTPSRPGTRAAVVTAGGESALVSSWADTLMQSWAPGGQSATYLYSDRPIYRPGDTVHLKGIDRVGYDGRYSIVSDVPAKLMVTNSRGDEAYTASLPLNDFGTFETSFEIPRDAPVGTWYVSAFDGFGYFEVEEYVPAAFKLTLESKEEYIAGDTLTLDVSAAYYFGLPVGNADVEYDVLAQDYYFDRVRDGYFSFGSPWYYCYDCGYGDSFVTRGRLTLDAEGKGTIEVPLTFANYFKDADTVGSKVFTLRVRTQDESGRQVAGTASAIVHRADGYLGVRVDRPFVGKHEEVAFALKSVDTTGAPKALRAITRTISRIEWRNVKRREVDGGYYVHSEETKERIDEKELSTDRDGNGSDRYTFEREGEYEIEVLARDSANNPIRATTRVYVYGDGTVEVRERNNAELEVKTDKASYAPGETGQVLFTSPFARAKALITVERGDIMSYAIRDVTGSLTTAPFIADRALVPNGYVSVTLLSPTPEVRFGQAGFAVASTERELTVRTTPNKRTYLPGEEVTLDISTTQADGTPVASELSLAVVDLSVLALVGNPKKNPVAFFYHTMPQGITTRASLKNILFERDIPTGTKGGGGGELEKRKRGDFRDTALWKGRVTTDADGKAQVRFTLPDNLTTWQIESLGLTKDLLVGVSYEEITSKKDLMVVPKKPRFILPGDHFKLGAQLMNDTDESISVELTVEAPTLGVEPTSRRVRVSARGSEQVYVEAVAPREGALHEVTFRAVSDRGEDTVVERIPLHTPTTFETTATAGVFTGSDATEYLYVPTYTTGEGEVTVRARATLAAFLLASARAMAGYPYGCVEQRASQAASLALAQRIFERFGTSTAERTVEGPDGTSVRYTDAIDQGLLEVYKLQNPDGGFAYFAGLESNYHLTLEVVRALGAIEEAGHTVREGVIAHAATYAQRVLATTPGLLEDPTSIASLALAFSYDGVPADLRQLPERYVAYVFREPLAREQLSSTELGYFAVAGERAGYDADLRERIFSGLTGRLALDGRGSYVRDAGNESWQLYGSTEKNTGLFLHALALRESSSDLGGNAMRWLMKARDGGDYWGSTNSTFTALEGALAYALARGEDSPEFALTFALDGAEQARTTYSRANALEVLEHVVPLTDVATNRLVPLTFGKVDEKRPGQSAYYDLVLRYGLPPEKVPPRDEGIHVERAFYTLEDEPQLRTSARVGEVLKGVLTITVPKERRAVAIEDHIPAGFELVNLRLATEGVRESSRERAMGAVAQAFNPPPPPSLEYEYGYAAGQGDVYYGGDIGAEPERYTTLYPSYEELRDDRLFAFVDTLAPGVYRYEYYVRALIPGTFSHLPVSVFEMYTPEVFGRTAGGVFTVEE